MASRSPISMIGSICPGRKSPLAVTLLLALALALSACGGDDESDSGASTETPAPSVESTATEEGGADTETATETETVDPETETQPQDGDGSSEDGQGGAGDEEAARTLALFTGRDGRITPRVIRVPAYISIRVELRSADGREYGLTFDGKTVSVSDGLRSASTTFDGLRPGARLVGEPTGASDSVRVEATAEPGP